MNNTENHLNKLFQKYSFIKAFFCILFFLTFIIGLSNRIYAENLDGTIIQVIPSSITDETQKLTFVLSNMTANQQYTLSIQCPDLTGVVNHTNALTTIPFTPDLETHQKTIEILNTNLLNSSTNPTKEDYIQNTPILNKKDPHCLFTALSDRLETRHFVKLNRLEGPTNDEGFYNVNMVIPQCGLTITPQKVDFDQDPSQISIATVGFPQNNKYGLVYQIKVIRQSDGRVIYFSRFSTDSVPDISTYEKLVSQLIYRGNYEPLSLEDTYTIEIGLAASNTQPLPTNNIALLCSDILEVYPDIDPKNPPKEPPGAQTPVNIEICNVYKNDITTKDECVRCVGGVRSDGAIMQGVGVYTALGCIKTDISGFINNFFTIGLGIAGGIALLFLIYGSFLVLTSQGNAEQIQQGREIITSAIAGLLLIIFSIFIFNLIANDVLKIPFDRLNKEEPSEVICDEEHPIQCGSGNVCCKSGEFCSPEDGTFVCKPIVPNITLNFKNPITSPLKTGDRLEFFLTGPQREQSYKYVILDENGNQIENHCEIIRWNPTIGRSDDITTSQLNITPGNYTVGIYKTSEQERYNNYCSNTPVEGQPIVSQQFTIVENITPQITIFQVPENSFQSVPRNNNGLSFHLVGPQKQLFLEYSILKHENPPDAPEKDIEFNEYCKTIEWNPNTGTPTSLIKTDPITLDPGNYLLGLYNRSSNSTPCIHNDAIIPFVMHGFTILP